MYGGGGGTVAHCMHTMSLVTQYHVTLHANCAFALAGFHPAGQALPHKRLSLLKLHELHSDHDHP